MHIGPGATGRRLLPVRRRFLLVTGMPRSGTTGVGSALARAPGTASFYEPLNPESGLTSVQEYFLFPRADGLGPELGRLLDRVFSVDLRIRRGVWPTDPGWRRVVKTITGSRTRVSAVRIKTDPRVRTVVWKDPFACFLLPTLRTEHALPSVITVRPPEASAASFKRLGWTFDLDRVDRHLARLAPGADFLLDAGERAAWPGDAVLTGALLWRLVYGWLDHSLPAPGCTTGPPALWANTRAVLERPLDTYAELYDTLGLPWTERSRAAIEREYRDEGRSLPQAGRTHDRGRNVQQANAYWSATLTDDEQEQVRRATDTVRRRVEDRAGRLG